MRIKTILTVALLCAAFGAQAQSTPAKTELAARIVKLQMPGIEGLARSLAEQPAVALLERVGPDPARQDSARSPGSRWQ